MELDCQASDSRILIYRDRAHPVSVVGVARRVPVRLGVIEGVHAAPAWYQDSGQGIRRCRSPCLRDDLPGEQ